ncbi:MAG TPA: hypothetical protein VD932_02600 [Aquabacterium sp.]|nr:hypothetical protein [Aquabacterium sp.]
MAVRTASAKVISLLQGDYDAKLAPSLSVHISTASKLVDRVATCATSQGTAHDSDTLELIERWLAAYFYTKVDRIRSSQNTGGAGGAIIQGTTDPEPYKAAAMELDWTGCLAALLKGNRGRVVWLGKTTGEQRTYDERNP